MNRQNSIIRIVAICLTILSAVAIQAAESLSVLLQKGIFAEETEGNLDAAIKIYEGIVKEADANRSVVAQAQYRLGVCELKRGKKEEAEAAFRKIISQFGDQTEISTKARERLGEMGKNGSSVMVRQILSGEEALGDTVSPDGRDLAFIDGETGNLACETWPRFRTGVSESLRKQSETSGPGQSTRSWVEAQKMSGPGSGRQGRPEQQHGGQDSGRAFLPLKSQLNGDVAVQWNSMENMLVEIPAKALERSRGDRPLRRCGFAGFNFALQAVLDGENLKPREH